MKKQLFAFLIVVEGVAYASNPIILDMLKPRHAPDVRGMALAFSQCDAKRALPQAVLAPLGVRFLESGQRPRFAFQQLLEDPSIIVLRSNDPLTTERVADGRFLAYGSAYELRSSIAFTSDVHLVGVGATAYVSLPRAVIGVTYKFNVTPSAAVAAINMLDGVSITVRPPLPTDGVWFTADAADKTVTCWYRPDAMNVGK